MESRQSLKFVQELLGKWEGIMVFPEGTYYRNRMGPGHVGLIRMIISRSWFPFIPTGVRYEAKRGHLEVQIKFVKPIYCDSSANPEHFVEHVMKEIARLSGYGYKEGMASIVSQE